MHHALFPQFHRTKIYEMLYSHVLHQAATKVCETHIPFQELIFELFANGKWKK